MQNVIGKIKYSITKPTSLPKVGQVPQGPDGFPERLREADLVFTFTDLDVPPPNQVATKIAFVIRSAPDVRRKL